LVVEKKTGRDTRLGASVGLERINGKVSPEFRKLPSSKFQLSISVPLYTEYQDILTRKEHLTGASTEKEILAFLRYLCKIANRKKIFYLWRPWLKDPKDDMVLELAVAAKSKYIITYNLKDFSNIQKFGIEAITPGRFLKILKEV